MPSRQVFTSRLRAGRCWTATAWPSAGSVTSCILPAPAHEPPRALGLVVTLRRRRSSSTSAGSGRSPSTARTCSAAPSTWTRSPSAPGRSWRQQPVRAAAPPTGPSPTSPSPTASWRAAAGRSPRSRSAARPRGCAPRGREIVPWEECRGAVRAGPAGRAADQPARDGAGRPGRRVRGAAAGQAQPARRRPGRRGTGRPARGDARAGPDPAARTAWATSSAAPTWSRRCSPTTPPTCSARCRRAAGAAADRDGGRAGRGTAPAAALRRGHRRRPDDLPAADLRARTRRSPRCSPGSGTRDMPVTTAAQVYVCEPPHAHADRPLPGQRRLPAAAAPRAVHHGRRVHRGAASSSAPDLPERELAARLAAYNLIGVAVCDERRAACSARSPSTTCSTTLLPGGWRQDGRLTMARLPSARAAGDRADLSVPRGAAPRMGARYDADAFGRFSEAIARFLGTGQVPGRPDGLRDRLDHRSTPSASSTTGTRTRSSCSTWPSPPRRRTPRR